MAECPKCKTSVGNAKFCPECGTKIPQEKVCPKCKTSVGKAKFCPECGTKIPQESDSEIDKKIDEFFAALEAASEEDKDEFFKLLDQDLKKKK